MNGSAVVAVPPARVATALRTWAATILIGALLVPILLIQPWRTYLNQGPIRSDGLGYFAWTRAVLDRDLDFCRYPSIEAVAAVKLPRPTPSDPTRVRCADRYPPGLAILQFPVMAILSYRSSPDVAVTSAQHDASVWLGGLALIGICIAVTATARRLGAIGWGVQAAVIAFTFGAGLFPYATFGASFVHIHGALMVALLVWAGVRTRQEGRSLLVGIVAGVAAFFIVSMRNIDLVIPVVLAIAFATWHLRTGEGTWPARARVALIDLLPVGAGIVAAAALQLSINHHMSGEWALSSYRAGEDFVFTSWHQRQVLFSYNRGLFIYAPVVFFTLVAGAVVTRTRALTAIYGSLVALLAVIYGFWFSWQLGGGAGFGHRGFVEIAPIGMLIAALVMAPARRAPEATARPNTARRARSSRRARVAFAVLALASALWTMQLAVLMWNYEYPEYIATPSIYWSHTIGADSLLARIFG